MAFTKQETDAHLATLEKGFWVHRRPPAHLRDEIREGQRIEGQSIELFFNRPSFQDPSRWIEEAIAKITYVRPINCWKLYWKRADGKWHSYPTCSKTTSLSKALQVIHEDSNYCFFG